MKRIACILLFLAIGLVSVYAQSSPAQKQFRQGIVNYLNEEGFKASIDEDDDIIFKKEGSNYWITIASESPFYVEMNVVGFNIEDANMNAILKACNYANLNKRCGKACLSDDSVDFTVEFYCGSVAAFKDVFSRSLNALDVIKKTTRDRYSELVD